MAPKDPVAEVDGGVKSKQDLVKDAAAIGSFRDAGAGKWVHKEASEIWTVYYSRQSHVLTVAVKRRVFDILKHRPMNYVDIATRCKITENGARVLVEALENLGFLEVTKEGPRPELILYAPSASAARLDSNHPQSFAPFFLAEYDTPITPKDLDQAMDINRVKRVTGGFMGDSIENTDSTVFTSMMAAFSKPNEPYLCGIVENMAMRKALEDKNAGRDAVNFKLADIGGGGGHYLAYIASQNENIDGHLLELAPVVKIAKKQNVGIGSERLSYSEGSFWDTQWPEADAYILGMILHDYGEDEVKKLIGFAYDNLKHGGHLIIIERFIMGEDEENDRINTMESVDMLVWAGGGKQYHDHELIRYCQRAGFLKFEFVRLPNYFHALVVSKM